MQPLGKRNNNRYRGPFESVKAKDFIESTYANINLLNNIFEEQKTSLKTVKEDIGKSYANKNFYIITAEV